MTDLLIFAGFFVILGVVVTLMILAEKARKKAITEKLSAVGMAVDFKPTPEIQAVAFSALGRPWSKLRTGSKGVMWVATGQVDALDVTLLEHRYTSGSGKNRSTHYHTVAATPAPEHWPAVELAPENFFHRIGELFGSKDFKLEDPAFNKKWRVKVDHEDFALLALTPEVQQWAMDLPAGMQIRIGRGAITLCRTRSVRGDDAADLVRRCVALALLIPEELGAWETGV